MKPRSWLAVELQPRRIDAPREAGGKGFSGRWLSLAVLGLSSLASWAEAANPPGFASFDEFALYVQQHADRPYRPAPPLPDKLADLSYDEYRQIQFRTGRRIPLAANRPYALEMFHRGFVQQDVVALNILQPSKAEPVPFSTDYFGYYGKVSASEIGDDVGFAGFRVVGTYAGRSDLQEMLTFLGSSYFRARAAKHIYGTSARGLAVDIGLPKTEEFPVFREFWIVDQRSEDASFRTFALLDSPSVCGAYEFVMRPGNEKTSIGVRARLFFRKVPAKIGLAPLTSMWMWGDGLGKPADDHRPEVHDADGLLMCTAQQTWSWRAFSRQSYPSVVRFPAEELRGFGLLQRDSNFHHYRDKEAKYDKRPSVWVEPTSAWQSGAIELLELPADHEGIDNIAAYWVPDEAPAVGKPIDLEYHIDFLTGDPVEHALGKATSYRIDRSKPPQIVLEIEFDGPNLASAGEELPMVSATAVRAEVKQATCQPNSDGSWTVRLDLHPTGEGPVETSAALFCCGQPVTETFQYLCPLKPPAVIAPPWRKSVEEVSE